MENLENLVQRVVITKISGGSTAGKLDEDHPQCADCNGKKKVQKRCKRFVK